MIPSYPGTGTNQARVLRYLRRHTRGLTQARVAEGLRMHPTSAKNALQSLDRKGWLEVDPDACVGRWYAWRLRDEWRHLVAERAPARLPRLMGSPDDH